MENFNDVIPFSLKVFYKTIFSKLPMYEDISNDRDELFYALENSDYKSITIESIKYYIFFQGFDKRTPSLNMYSVDIIYKRGDGHVNLRHTVSVKDNTINHYIKKFIRLKDRKTLEKLFLLKELV
jgi:hypothetical protein